MSQQEKEFQKESVLLVFGENIRKAREKQNIGLAQLATQIRYDRICLSKLEHGEQNIKLTTALKLAGALNVSFPTLFSRNFMIGQADENVDFVGAYFEDDYLKVFSENFKRSLLYKQNNQSFVYIETGVTESVVSRIVRGRVYNPTIQTLSALAFSANEDMYSLFSRTQTKEERS